VFVNNLKDGIHSLTVKADKIVVESNFVKESFVSIYTLKEYDLAVFAFKRLTQQAADIVQVMTK
jgi:hypothetical protein